MTSLSDVGVAEVKNHAPLGLLAPNGPTPSGIGGEPATVKVGPSPITGRQCAPSSRVLSTTTSGDPAPTKATNCTHAAAPEHASSTPIGARVASEALGP